MGRSGYTSLSIEEKRYARIRRSFETTVTTEKTFTVWAMETLENAISKEAKLKKSFGNLHYVGNTSNGCIIEDKGDLVEINVSGSVGKYSLACSQDKNICNHVLFAVLHPNFLF